MKNALVVIACGALLVAGCQAESRNPPNSISDAKDSAPLTLDM